MKHHCLRELEYGMGDNNGTKQVPRSHCLPSRHHRPLGPYALRDPLLPPRYASKSLCFRLDPRANSPYMRAYIISNSTTPPCAPEAEGYADHFLHSCKAPAAIRNRELQADDPVPVLFAAYIMMLDNDGGSRA